jgi:predicted transcriptional regulator
MKGKQMRKQALQKGRRNASGIMLMQKGASGKTDMSSGMRPARLILAAGTDSLRRQLDTPEDVEEELTKLFRSMHLMSERDVDATVTRVFRAMMQMGREEPVGSTDISRFSGLNRITVIHHLKRLEIAGVVKKQEAKYVLRCQSVEGLMEEMRSDMERQFEQMEALARQIDLEFGMFEREIHERKKRSGKR